MMSNSVTNPEGLVGTSLQLTFRKRQRRVDVLQGASLAFPPGSLTSIMGRSGSGKTSLMLILGGLMRPDSGNVTWQGLPITAPELHYLSEVVGFLFQKFHLIPYLTVEQNLRLGASPGTDPDPRPWLERLQLLDRRQHYPSELSVGEQQRVALGRAIIRNPKILLADEPCGNLDAENAQIVLNALREQAAAGSVVVIVTHDPAAAAKSDRILRLDQGVLHPIEQAGASDL